MKKLKLLFVMSLLLLVGCVQKTYKKTVVFYLTVAGIKNIQSAGVRGEGRPLSWNKDLPMTTVIKDSIYTVTLSKVTGYKFTEVKFTVNGEFEFQNEDNRKIFYSETDTTIYNAVFNKRK